jgi:hypothetical protein
MRASKLLAQSARIANQIGMVHHHSSRRRDGGSVRAFGAVQAHQTTKPTNTAMISNSSNTVLKLLSAADREA